MKFFNRLGLKLRFIIPIILIAIGVILNSYAAIQLVELRRLSSSSSSTAEDITVENFSITKPEAVNLIKSWLIDKQESYHSPYNMQPAYKYTTGSYLERVEGTVRWLKQNNAEYEYQQPRVEASGQFFVQGNQATIDVRITENATLYLSGAIDWSSSGPSTGVYRFSLQVDKGIWKIANSQKIGQ